MEDDEARSEGTFRYTVHNFRNLKNAVLSPPCYVRKLPWKIMAKQYPRGVPYHQSQKSLGFFLQCNVESESSTWSCYAEAELRLISHKPNCEAFIRRIQHLFYSKENEWGFAHFLPWNDVLDPEKGFIKDETITLEVHVTAEAPHGVSWTPIIPDMPKLSSNNIRLRSRKVCKTVKNTKKLAFGKTKKMKSKKTTKFPKYFCLVCGDPYAEPPQEDWIQCGDCTQWAHESCTSYKGLGSYFCDVCHE